MSSIDTNYNKMVFLLHSTFTAITLSYAVALVYMGFLLHTDSPVRSTVAWILAISIIGIVRWFYINYWLRNQKKLSQSINGFAYPYLFLTLITGFIWVCGYFMALPYLSEMDKAIALLVMGGICTGSVATYSVYLPAFQSFVMPIFIPILLHNAYLTYLSPKNSFIFVLLIIFYATLVTTSRNNNRLLVQTFALSKEKDQLIKKLKCISVTDALTGLFNRRDYDNTVQNELNKANRHGYALSLLSIDIDNFKTVNDIFGHLRGDCLLKELATELRKTFQRADDIIFRVGGDEFSVLLSQSTLEDALAVTELCQKNFNANRVVKKINRTELMHDSPLSLSIGLLHVLANSTDNVEALFANVDRALYKAKHQGKDRLVVHVLSQDATKGLAVKEYGAEAAS